MVFTPDNKNDLQNAVNGWIDGTIGETTDVPNGKGDGRYGHINNWDVSNITDMSSLFSGQEEFNDDIGNWDTSSVTNMYRMFYKCKALNQDLNTKEVTVNGETYTAWDTSLVNNMKEMFYECEVFNKPIDNWNTSSATLFSGMFNDCKAFNQDLNTKQVIVNGKTYTAWDTKKVYRMDNMFKRCEVFNGDISNWNTSSLEWLYMCFNDCRKFDININTKEVTVNDETYTAWNTSKLTRFEGLRQAFQGCTEFNQDLNGWDFSGGPEMTAMFRDCRKFNGNISNWDLSKCGKIQGMFWGCHVFNQDLSWNIVGVKNIIDLFKDCVAFNGNISNWDTSTIERVEGMFNGAHSFNGDISRWDTSKVTRMGDMFRGAESFNGDISRWDTSSVTDMEEMFYGAHSFNGDISRWDTSKVEKASFMFCDAKAFNGDISRWDTSSVGSMRDMFSGAKAFNGDISRWDTSGVTNMKNMFKGAEIFNGDISRWDTSSVTEMYGMFQNAINFSGDIYKWDITKVRSGSSGFRYMLENTALATNVVDASFAAASGAVWAEKGDVSSLNLGEEWRIVSDNDPDTYLYTNGDREYRITRTAWHNYREALARLQIQTRRRWFINKIFPTKNDNWNLADALWSSYGEDWDKFPGTGCILNVVSMRSKMDISPSVFVRAMKALTFDINCNNTMKDLTVKIEGNNIANDNQNEVVEVSDKYWRASYTTSVEIQDLTFEINFKDKKNNEGYVKAEILNNTLFPTKIVPAGEVPFWINVIVKNAEDQRQRDVGGWHSLWAHQTMGTYNNEWYKINDGGSLGTDKMYPFELTASVDNVQNPLKYMQKASYKWYQ